MQLAPGARLGPYEIVAAIGAGGMGEVYRARDTRLDRTVAVKVLPAQFAADPQLRERFEREARTISSLNHPHICALFDIGHQDDVEFLVLEFLEGQTLAERLSAGAGPRALEMKDALRVAIEIGDALDRAHRAGIVHRDLKPANVMLTKSGAKLLDFGLAKAAAPVVAASGLSMLPTTPPNVTAQGTILGTFQYMAPEQIEGVDADARTDIFAFGALLFEMITGRTAFEGTTRASLLGAILKDEPPSVSTLWHRADGERGWGRASIKAIDRIISTCLAKDPDDRWQSARDLHHELKWVASGAADSTAEVAPPARAKNSRLWTVAIILALGLVATAVVAVNHLREAPPPGDAMQFTIPVPENSRFGGPTGGGTGTATQLAVSPDGRHVVFVATNQNTYILWLRSMGAPVARPIPGSEQASFPFWSPDSRFIGFFAAGKLKKVQVAGGPPIILCDAINPRGGTWNTDNVIVFGGATGQGIGGGGLQRVSAAGGVPAAITSLDAAYGDTSHRWPHFLPDGKYFFYTAVTGPGGASAKPSLVKVGMLGSTDSNTLFQAESSAAYSQGHLFFWRDGTLMAQPFDAEARHMKGDAFPVAEQVSAEGSRYAGFSVSRSGVMVYGRGATNAEGRLTWFDRAGTILGAAGETGRYSNLALSADERYVAVTLGSGSPENRDIWVIDVMRGGGSRLTFDPADEINPVWSPDRSRVAFGSLNSSSPGMRIKLASGTANDELLLNADAGGSVSPTDWSRDGRFIAYSQATTGRGQDVWILPMSGDRKPFPFLQTQFSEDGAVFSPDGHWIAYYSTESGQPQVYVQPFPPTGGKFLVSKSGGSQPIWRGDGKEMFFLAPDRTIMATAINTTRGFEAGVAQPMFTSGITLTFRRQYAVSRDGKRFLVNVVQQQPSALPLTVVVNWPAAVQK